MYGIFTYIGVVLGVNVGIYGIHGVSGNVETLHCITVRFIATRKTHPGLLGERKNDKANAGDKTLRGPITHTKAGQPGQGLLLRRAEKRLATPDPFGDQGAALWVLHERSGHHQSPRSAFAGRCLISGTLRTGACGDGRREDGRERRIGSLTTLKRGDREHPRW